ncbi:MAG: hypothetical protein H0U45_12220 [Tatlockia sp.]|nr:hypothetical protein [Tatlockia sp.]
MVSVKRFKKLAQQYYTYPLTRQIFHKRENCWSKVKEFLRARAARTYADLDQAITDALAAVTTKDIIGWFTHCCCYISPN